MIWVGSLFHLFPEQEQIDIAHKLTGLLSPEPGSMIIGTQGGRSDVKGPWYPTQNPKNLVFFLYTTDTWIELWHDVFGKESVKVHARLRPQPGGLDYWGTFPGNKDQPNMIDFAVVRL